MLALPSATLAIVSAVPALAADEVVMVPIRDAYAQANIDQYLDKSVTFYFGNAPHPAIVQNFGSFTANHRASTIAHAEQRACSRAFLSSLLSLHQRAKSLGADAVVDIVSYFRKKDVSSTTAFECHQGTLLTGVTLKGDVVRLRDR